MGNNFFYRLFGIDKNNSMTYKEAVKYMEKNRITREDMMDLESRGDCMRPSSLSVDDKYLQAEKIIQEHNLQKFLNTKLP
jgi:hypothetical protein